MKNNIVSLFTKKALTIIMVLAMVFTLVPMIPNAAESANAESQLVHVDGLGDYNIERCNYWIDIDSFENAKTSTGDFLTSSQAYSIATASGIDFSGWNYIQYKKDEGSICYICVKDNELYTGGGYTWYYYSEDYYYFNSVLEGDVWNGPCNIWCIGNKSIKSNKSSFSYLVFDNGAFYYGVDGELVTDSDITSKYSYANGVLELNNFSLTSTYPVAIYVKGDIKIRLVGNNSITVSNDNYNIGIFSVDNIEFIGSGTLNIDVSTGYYNNEYYGYQYEGYWYEYPVGHYGEYAVFANNIILNDYVKLVGRFAEDLQTDYGMLVTQGMQGLVYAKCGENEQAWIGSWDESEGIVAPFQTGLYDWIDPVDVSKPITMYGNKTKTVEVGLRDITVQPGTSVTLSDLLQVSGDISGALKSQMISEFASDCNIAIKDDADNFVSFENLSEGTYHTMITNCDKIRENFSSNSNYNGILFSWISQATVTVKNQDQSIYLPDPYVEAVDGTLHKSSEVNFYNAELHQKEVASIQEAAKDWKVQCRTKVAKKGIRTYCYLNGLATEELYSYIDKGYTVTYDWYRADGKGKKFKYVDSTDKYTYLDNSVKKGKYYEYKVKVNLWDEDGNIYKSTLADCAKGFRTF